MTPNFQLATQLITDVCHLPFHCLNTEKDMERFIQIFQNPYAVKKLFQTPKTQTICHVIMPFEIHFLLFFIDKTPVTAGPFCTMILTKQDCFKYIHHYRLSQLTAADLSVYRSQFPIISEEEALHITRCLLHHLVPARKPWETEHIIWTSDPFFQVPQAQESPLRKNYSELIQERYQLEQSFMKEIEDGNAREAILNLRNMERDVAFLKEMGTTLEKERIGAAIVRTMVRIAASRAGLPAAAIDLLSTENTIAVQNARTIEVILKEKEKLVNSFCEKIHSHKQNQYSNLVLSAMHYIKQQYPQDISVRQLAQDLNVTCNRLISVFRTETGQTPGSYILKVRISQGAKLLSTTDLMVQQISSMVGIPDANYFVKCFKREYGIAPTRYRKYYRL